MGVGRTRVIDSAREARSAIGKRIRPVQSCRAPLLLVAAILSPIVDVSGSSSARAGQPIVLADQGAFFVGGHYQATPNGAVMAGQMYVEFEIPAHRTHAFPIVMIHGQGQSGANFISTPDGRPGWMGYFVRHGYAVYVVDQPGRGRSAYHADIDGPTQPFTAEVIEKVFTDPQSANLWPSARLHDQWPGSGQPGDPSFDQFYASEMDSGADTAVRMDELNQSAGAALLDRIGPAILLTHSRAGPFGWLIADARPGKVKAIIAVEPWGPPFRETIPKPSATTRPWGLSVARMTFSPPVRRPDDLAPIEQANHDGPQPCLLPTAPDRTLPALLHTPVAVVTGEASYHSAYDGCTVAFLRNAGVTVDHLKLASLGIHGNGHMMMLERNSDEIAAVLDTWLSAHVDVTSNEPRPRDHDGKALHRSGRSNRR